MTKALNPPQRVLMGPGPSNVHPSVLRSMTTPLLGHLDPAFLTIMDETMALLRKVFQTENHLTIPMSGTGSAGMETVLVNLIEAGDKVIIGVSGVFSARMVEIAKRCGAEVITVESNWGEIIEPAAIEDALKNNPGVKLVALVQAETSTGICQPLEEISKIVHNHDALIVVDMVASMGGIPSQIDKLNIDAAYSGSQKCLSAPPGLAPVTFNERALEVINNRKTKVLSWYLDVSLIQEYWGEERTYHHTAPITMVYALHEALRLIVDEGLENVYERHEKSAKELYEGLEEMGLELLVKDEKDRACSLTTVKVPEGIDDAKARKYLLDKYGIEIGGGLGAFKGKVWRIGLMGYNARPLNVALILSALKDAIKAEGNILV